MYNQHYIHWSKNDSKVPMNGSIEKNYHKVPMNGSIEKNYRKYLHLLVRGCLDQSDWSDAKKVYGLSRTRDVGAAFQLTSRSTSSGNGLSYQKSDLLGSDLSRHTCRVNNNLATTNPFGVQQPFVIA